MIPKIIHYCWFGRNPEPPIMQKCIESWQRFMPDFVHKRWTEDSITRLESLYLAKAMAAKQWANVSNWVRNYAIYMEGGIYLDVDVEVIKPLTPLLHQKAFFGCETKQPRVNNAVIGAEACNLFFIRMIANLDDFFTGTEPANESSPVLTTELLNDMGLGPYQETPWLVKDIMILPTDYFYPDFDGAAVNPTKITDRTLAIHHWQASWKKGLVADASKKQQKYKQQKKEKSKS